MLPVLLPYKPSGSEELFYIPQREASSSSGTTMESSHPGMSCPVPHSLYLKTILAGHILLFDSCKFRLDKNVCKAEMAEFCELNCAFLFPLSPSGEQLVFCNLHRDGSLIIHVQGLPGTKASWGPNRERRGRVWTACLF